MTICRKKYRKKSIRQSNMQARDLTAEYAVRSLCNIL